MFLISQSGFMVLVQHSLFVYMIKFVHQTILTTMVYRKQSILNYKSYMNSIIYKIIILYQLF